MFEKFTERARHVMALANQEAQRLNHEYIGTEHILLGLVKEGSGVGANALKYLGVDLLKVRAEVEKLVKPGPDMVTAGKLPQTPKAKKVLEYAIAEARNLNHNYVGKEHLLLGLLREPEGVAGQVLMHLGLKLDDVRKEVLTLLGTGLYPAEPAPSKAEPAPDSIRVSRVLSRPFVVTPAMGKRLIGRAMVQHPAVQAVLEKGTLVIVAGTTNGYVAEEVLKSLGCKESFSRAGFRRGVTLPPHAPAPPGELHGDVVIVNGVWQKGKEIFDVVNDMQKGDVILKGANAVNLAAGQAGVLIGHPMGGTIGAAVPAAIGRRVRLIVPVGVEKRVDEEIADLAAMLNSPDAEGPRMMPIPGEAFTELDAIRLLTGAEAVLTGGGGVCGAEGAAWITVRGIDSQVAAAGALISGVSSEPLCQP